MGEQFLAMQAKKFTHGVDKAGILERHTLFTAVRELRTTSLACRSRRVPITKNQEVLLIREPESGGLDVVRGNQLVGTVVDDAARELIDTLATTSLEVTVLPARVCNVDELTGEFDVEVVEPEGSHDQQQ